jgi:hypothetical protein
MPGTQGAGTYRIPSHFNEPDMGHGRNVYMGLGRAGQSHELGMEGFHVLKLDSEKRAAQRCQTTFEPPLLHRLQSKSSALPKSPARFRKLAGLLASHVLEHGLRLRLTGIIASLPLASAQEHTSDSSSPPGLESRRGDRHSFLLPSFLIPDRADPRSFSRSSGPFSFVVVAYNTVARTARDV